MRTRKGQRKRMYHAVGQLNRRRGILNKTLKIDPLLHSGNSYAWHVWLWWLDVFKLIEQARAYHALTQITRNSK